MPRYNVTLIFDSSQTVEVEAESPEQAAEIAESNAEPLSLCHQCSGEVNGGDCIGVHVYDDECTEMLADTTHAGDLSLEIENLRAKVAQLDAANKEWQEQVEAGKRLLREEMARANRYAEAEALWHDKTEWLRKDLRPHELGKHLADVLRERLEKAEQRIGHLGSALGDIASGEILRSHCYGPHCTEEMGIATADEMSGRAAGALEWDAKNAN